MKANDAYVISINPYVLGRRIEGDLPWRRRIARWHTEYSVPSSDSLALIGCLLPEAKRDVSDQCKLWM